jgi:signal peptidase I
MNKSSNQPKIFKIGLKIRIVFFVLMIAYISYKLIDYSLVHIPNENNEMMPLIKPSQTIVIFKRPVNEYRINDIVLASKNESSDIRLYRVLAKDSGNIKIKNGSMSVNEKEIEIKKFHLPHDLNRNFNQLQKGEYFLIHDNQNTDSPDSIIEGPYDNTKINIIGKVFFYWPNNTEVE